MCFVWIWEKQRLFPYTTLTGLYNIHTESVHRSAISQWSLADTEYCSAIWHIFFEMAPKISEPAIFSKQKPTHRRPQRYPLANQTTSPSSSGHPPPHQPLHIPHAGRDSVSFSQLRAINGFNTNRLGFVMQPDVCLFWGTNWMFNNCIDDLQVTDRRPLTVEDRVQSQPSLCHICVEQEWHLDTFFS